MAYQTDEPKPYNFVQFSNNPPTKLKPAEHHKYIKNHIHGTLHLELIVGTGVHVSTGRVVMGSDIGQRDIQLIKTMSQGSKAVPIIPGSSLKGVVRSVYEAITGSCLCKVKLKGKTKTKASNKISFELNIPKDYHECSPRKEEITNRQVKLCPACKIFGSLNVQGLVSLNDARLEKTNFDIGFIPPLHEPQRDCTEYYVEQINNIHQQKLTGNLIGRKFYYHAVKAIDKGSKLIPVQKVSEQNIFQTQLHLKNLTMAEFGALMIALGQDQQYPFALKVGSGKPIGMGTMEVKPVKFEQATSLKARYSNYAENSIQEITGERLAEIIRQAIQQSHHEQLVQREQLNQLQEILEYPTNRQASSDGY